MYVCVAEKCEMMIFYVCLYVADDEKKQKNGVFFLFMYVLGHSGQIGNMRHSGTLKTQNLQFGKVWKY